MNKTVELSWVEDYNHNLAEDCLMGLQDLIGAGVFPDLEANVTDDILTITGPAEQIDKAIEKIQKSYIDYGQIVVKELKNESIQEATKIKSFDLNIQDLFDHTAAYFSKFKSLSAKKRPHNYVSKLNEFQLKFMKFKEAAKGTDKVLIQNYIDEVQNLLDEDEGVTPIIKPLKHSGRKMKRKDDYKEKDSLTVANPNDGGEYYDGNVHVYEAPADNEAFKIQQAIDLCEENGIKVRYNEAIKQQLSNLQNWGIIEEDTETYIIEQILNKCTNPDMYYEVARMLVSPKAESTRISQYGLREFLFDNKYILTDLNPDLEEISDSDVPSLSKCSSVILEWFDLMYDYGAKEAIKDMTKKILEVAIEDRPDALTEILERI